MNRFFQNVLAFALAVFIFATGAVAQAADRAKVEAFMEVTGFNVALDSMRLGAGAAPDMLGLREGDFGSDWTRLADRVFETSKLQSDALDILVQTMDDEMLNHAAGFYASDLGQRLVAAENSSHMADDVMKDAEGAALVADLVTEGSPRLEIFKGMTAAIGSTESSIQAVTEIQVRFLLAAMNARLLTNPIDEAALRNALKQQEPDMRASMAINALTGNAYTYQAFTEDEIAAYQEALEQPLMQKVYELMAAVQFHLMAERFQILAAQMGDLHPAQEI